MAAILIVKPGLLTTVQDLGRWGQQASGVPVAGPMDPFSHRLANALVGNAPGAALFEITLTGPEIVFEDERRVAVCGARFELRLDGHSAPFGSAFAAPGGARLTFLARRQGARAYLAISGGIAVPAALGSRATHLLTRMGGYRGRALAGGDRIPLGDTTRAPTPDRMDARPGRGADDIRSIPSGHARVRVRPGPQDDRFDAGALELLQSAPYTIAGDSDRMGFRLIGPRIERSGSGEIISDATPLGALQVPASGEPVLLMADRQTTGGYPVIATLISADVGLAGQLAPGDTISFSVCSRGEALAALIAQERALMAAGGACA